MPIQEVLIIPSEGVAAYQALADIAGQSPEGLAKQVLCLGVNLAKIALLSGDQNGCSILYEQPEGRYSPYAINFKVKHNAAQPCSPDEDFSAIVDGLTADRKLFVEVDGPLMRQAEMFAELFRVRRAEFLDSSMAHRLLWAQTRGHQGSILINDGDIDEDYIVAEEELLEKLLSTTE